LIGTENWRTSAHRYLKFCERNGVASRDLSGLSLSRPFA